MKQDFELLKEDTEVIYNGIRTMIEAFRIYRPSWMYDGTDEEAKATLGDFYNSTGTHFYELDVEQMNPNMIYWDYDYVRIDTSDIPSYLRDLNEIVSLSYIDLAQDITNLTYDELEKLRREICIGSIYSSDYANSLFIDRNELRGYCEEYETWIEKENIEDSPENFAFYFSEVA